jgi:hypothetical protein
MDEHGGVTALRIGTPRKWLIAATRGCGYVGERFESGLDVLVEGAAANGEEWKTSESREQLSIPPEQRVIQDRA